MTVQVELPDGRSVEFPDGVTPDVVERTTKSLIAGKPVASADTGPLGGLPLSASGQTYSTGHVGEAIAEGYRTAPQPYSKEELENANQTWFGYAINNPLMRAANLAVAGGAGLFRGGQEFVQEALSPISPQLGRDVAAMPEAFMGSPHGVGPILPEPGLPGYIRNTMTRDEPPRPPGPAQTAERYPEQLMLSAPEPPPAAPPAAPPSEAIPMPAPKSYWERLYAEGRAPAPGFEPQVTMREPGAAPTAPEPPGAVKEPQPAPSPAPQLLPGTPTNQFMRPSPEVPAATPRSEPQPEAVGADRTTAQIPELTKTQTQDAFEKSVLQTAEDRAGPQMVDHTPYVYDSQGNPAQRTEAAREFSEEASAHEKALGDADPAFKQKNREIQDENNRIVFDDYKRQAGDNHAIDEAVKARARYSPDELGVFEKQTPTDMGQKIVDYFNQLLATREGKRGNVASILKEARDAFLDKDGNPEVMPSMLYGGRLNLTDILNEGLGSSTSTRKGSVQAARHFLTEALNEHVDPAIKDGAPLFEEFRKNWSELSKPIDRMEFLQQHLFGPGDVRGADGKIQFQAMQNLLEKMAKLRRMPGNNPAKSFDLEHLDQLIAIRNELAAWHLRDRLGRTAGSDTHQRAQAAATLKAGPLGQAISGAVDAAGHAIAFKVAGPPGNVAYQMGGRPVVQKVLKYRSEKALDEVKRRMLEVTPRNQLGPPGS